MRALPAGLYFGVGNALAHQRGVGYALPVAERSPQFLDPRDKRALEIRPAPDRGNRVALLACGTSSYQAAHLSPLAHRNATTVYEVIQEWVDEIDRDRLCDKIAKFAANRLRAGEYVHACKSARFRAGICHPKFPASETYVRRIRPRLRARFGQRRDNSPLTFTLVAS